MRRGTEQQSDQNPNRREPITIAFLFFCGLTVIIITSFSIINFDRYNVVGLLFMTAFVTAALIAKSVYDSLTLSDEMARTEERISHDIAIASEELHTQLYQNSPVPYLLLDQDGVVTSANMAAGRLYGVAQGMLQGKDIFDTFRTSDREHVTILFQKFKTKVPINGETIRVARPDGEEAWVLLSLFQFTNSYGSQIGLLTLVDISKQKQIENAKAEFVSLASHQLRTPIAAVKWSAELLQLDPEKSLGPKQQRYVERLLLGVNRMSVLVDDFLRVSRFELGTFQPEFTAVNLGSLLESVIGEQEVKVRQKGLVIKTFFDPIELSLITDQNLVRMITSNLFSNAVKYTKNNGTIHIGYKKQGANVVLTVADNGMGIPIKDQERVFSKLFRASNATRSVPDGTGLGLYIAREATKVLKGKISFSSVENMSTTFEVTLPLEEVT